MNFRFVSFCAFLLQSQVKLRKDIHTLSLEEERSMKSVSPKTTATPSYQSSQAVLSSGFTRSLRDQPKIQHSYTSPAPSRSPHDIGNQAAAVKSVSPKTTATPSYQSSQAILSSGFTRSFRDQPKIQHSYTSPAPSRSPHDIGNEAAAVKSIRPKTTATPSYQSSQAILSSGFTRSLRDQPKMQHSYTSPAPSRSPHDIGNQAAASDLLLDWRKFSLKSTQMRGYSSEEFKSASTTEALQGPIPTRLSFHDTLAAGGIESPVNLKKHFIIHHCQLQSFEPLNVYVPVMNPTYEDHHNLIRKFDIGESNMWASEKVIMMVGATGSGKSTLINALFNYIFDIKLEDNFRLKLVEEKVLNQAESVTKYISSYTIHHQHGFNVPFTITVIDTPGFGDRKGIKSDQEITKQIKTFFTIAGPSGIDRLDAVAFVTYSSLARLTPSQKYILDSILALFGKDIENCIMLLLTFADGQKPQILDSIKEAGFPYRRYLKFNNSALYISNKDNTDTESDDDNDDDDDDDDDDDMTMAELFWNVNEKSFKSFVKELSKVKPTSLFQTKDVLGERFKLETSIEFIQKEIKLGREKLDRLATEVKMLYSELKDKNGDSKHELSWVKMKTDPSRNTTKYYEHEKKVNRLLGLKTSHRDGKKLAAEQIIKKCANEFEASQKQLRSLAEAARKNIQRLEEIALRPNPLYVVEYIDILIKGEEMEGKPFWQDRVSQLQEVRERAVYVKQLINQNLGPFEEYREKNFDERIENRRGVWTIAMEYLEKGIGSRF